MLASAGRSRSGDRFYNPPAVRRQLQLQQQQQQEQQQVLSDKQKLDKDNKQAHNEQQSSHRPARIQRTRSSAESDDCASSTSATATPPASMSSHSPSRSGSCLSNLTNLDRFLESTTPLVPGQHFSKTSMAELRTQEDEFQPYFVLGDLWDSFKEWSTFGAGVPLILNGSDSVVQYYVPYLSAIQLYIDPNMNKLRTRKPGLESDTNSSRGSSNGSSDYERERGLQPQQQDLVEASRQTIKGLSISNKILNGSSSYEGESVSSQGVLAFEFLEYDPPFCREPLADKVSFLASQFPQLMTYRSCDLSPASWVSVAWYPIYRIPIGPTLQNLDSCFLTFHYLTKPDCAAAQNERQCLHGSSHPREARCGFDMASKLSLPVFGLASYKFKTAAWDQTGADASVKASSLWQAADDWLQSLNVKHPDYRFFESHNSYPR